MNRVVWVLAVFLLSFLGAALFFALGKIRSETEISELIQQREELTLVGRTKFLRMTGLMADDLEHIEFYEGLMYQSKRFGDTRYVFKAIGEGDRVVFFQGRIIEKSLDLEQVEIGFKQVVHLDFGKDGGFKGVSYGEQGSLSVVEFRNLILSKGQGEGVNRENQSLLKGKKSLLQNL